MHSKLHTIDCFLGAHRAATICLTVCQYIPGTHRALRVRKQPVDTLSFISCSKSFEVTNDLLTGKTGLKSFNSPQLAIIINPGTPIKFCKTKSRPL